MRRRTCYLDCATTPDLRRELRQLARAKPTILLVDHADVLTRHDDRAALASLLDDLAVGSSDLAVVIGVRDPSCLPTCCRPPPSPSRFTRPTRTRGPSLMKERRSVATSSHTGEVGHDHA